MNSFETVAEESALLTPAHESPTRHPVYKDEYGVVLLANSVVANAAKRIRQEYFPETPPLVPHITLIQGCFSKTQREDLIKTIADEARSIRPVSIKMDINVVKGGGGNTFWDVVPKSEGWEFCDTLNGRLCEKVPHPVGQMRQIKDDVDANPDLIAKWGRDFNVPGHNRPHITVVYGQQDETLYHKIQEVVFKKQALEFIPTGMALVRIDYLGNIVKVIEEFPFSGS